LRSFVIVQTTQDDVSVAVAADYSAFVIDNPDEGSDRFADTSLTYDVKKEIPLNSNGIGWISKTGFTKFGMRESNYDVDNVLFGINSEAVYFYSTEATGTDNDPYLDVTYSEGGTARRKPPIVVTY
jgi:hypothetical protein